MNSRRMMGLIGLLGLVALVLTFAGCSEETKNPLSKTARENRTPETVSHTVPPVGASQAVTDCSIKMAIVPEGVPFDPDHVRRIGDASSRQLVYVYIDGEGPRVGAHFGIESTRGVEIHKWTPTVEALEIQSDDWPRSGSWKAMAWSPEVLGAAGGGPLLLGYLTIDPGPGGVIRITGLDLYGGDVGLSPEAGMTARAPVDAGVASIQLNR